MSKLQMNKAVSINSVAGATVPDAIARIGNISLDESTGELTYAMHFYLTEADADNGAEPVAFKTYIMTIANLQNQIIAHAKLQPEFDAATDI